MAGMGLRRRITERRQRKAHERYLQERDRQRELANQDAQDAVTRSAQGSGVAQQGMFGQGP